MLYTSFILYYQTYIDFDIFTYILCLFLIQNNIVHYSEPKHAVVIYGTLNKIVPYYLV